MVARGDIMGDSYKDTLCEVVNIDNFGTFLFFGQINNLETSAEIVGNAYPYDLTKEKLYTMSGSGKYNLEYNLNKPLITQQH